jgi:hypothetical protein
LALGWSFQRFLSSYFERFILTTELNISLSGTENAVIALELTELKSQNVVTSFGLGCYNKNEKERGLTSIAEKAYHKPISAFVLKKTIYRFLENR